MENKEVAEGGLDLKHHSVSPRLPPSLRWGKLRLHEPLYTGMASARGCL